MSTREADHDRGRYYMHTGFVPNPNIEHPSYGSVVAHELMANRNDLEIPPFISVGGASEGPGFLGMAWAPFSVSSDGHIRNLGHGLEGQSDDATDGDARLDRRWLYWPESWTGQRRSSKILKKTFDLMTSDQMEAFKVEKEPEAVQESLRRQRLWSWLLDGASLGRSRVSRLSKSTLAVGIIMRVFTTSLQNQRLPVLDQAMSALGRRSRATRTAERYRRDLDG